VFSELGLVFVQLVHVFDLGWRMEDIENKITIIMFTNKLLAKLHYQCGLFHGLSYGKFDSNSNTEGPGYLEFLLRYGRKKFMT
jgi:hypothetical protein